MSCRLCTEATRRVIAFSAIAFGEEENFLNSKPLLLSFSHTSPSVSKNQQKTANHASLKSTAVGKKRIPGSSKMVG